MRFKEVQHLLREAHVKDRSQTDFTDIMYVKNDFAELQNVENQGVFTGETKCPESRHKRRMFRQKVFKVKSR